MVSLITIETLPNEMLMSILSTLPTRSLVPLVQVNRRFYAVTICLLHQRLKRAASLPDHRLILECFHPSRKLETPYLFCDYLSTDTLEGVDDGEYSFPEHRVSGLRGLYSHFRPVVQEENRRPRARYPTQAQQQQAQAEEDGQSSQAKPEADAETEMATHGIHLDDGELFSQLCTITNLVKVGPKRGLFLSHVNVSEGVIRVWRDWLAVQANGDGGSTGRESARARDPILWADPERNVGLRFRVVERDVAAGQRPVLAAADEDLPVSYRLEFQELLVRTHQLLLMVEKSEMQEVNTSGFFIEPRGSIPCPVQTFFWADPYYRGVRAYWSPMVIGSA